MRDRVVVIAMGVTIAYFLFFIVWPILDDDPPSPLQTAYATVALVIAAGCALFYWSGPS